MADDLHDFEDMKLPLVKLQPAYCLMTEVMEPEVVNARRPRQLPKAR
jgi:hypothetical protein